MIIYKGANLDVCDIENKTFSQHVLVYYCPKFLSMKCKQSSYSGY